MAHEPLLDGLTTVRLNQLKPTYLRPKIAVKIDTEEIPKDLTYSSFLTCYRMTLVLGAEVVSTREGRTDHVRDMLRRHIANGLYGNILEESYVLIEKLHEEDIGSCLDQVDKMIRLMR